MSRYAIWNKIDNIYTPIGEVLTPEQWIQRYGWIGNPKAIPVISDDIINGSFCGELSQMKKMYESRGADFSACTTNAEILEEIELFEDALNAPVEEITAEERIAAALEYQVLASLDDAETA